jgi:hypothetical protein
MRQPILARALFCAGIFAAEHVRADFASPPGERSESVSYGRYDPYAPAGRPLTWVRVSTGPATRLSAQAPVGGLVAALEIGKAGAGFRTGAAWTGAGWDRGQAQYSGEIWVDLGTGGVFRPTASAGAALVRRDSVPVDGQAVRTSTLGAAVLRGALGVLLPIEATDARAAIEATFTLPATQDGPEPVQPWVLLAMTVGVGF